MRAAPLAPSPPAPRPAEPALPLEYVLPLRWGRDADPRDAVELAAYLERLATWLPVTVVDGSEPDVWQRHHALFAPYARHVAPQPWPGRNGKVAGVVTGLALAREELVVIADDDVRWERDGLERLVGLLEGCTLVRPQNVFAELPWHARWDTARSLLNRAVGADYPGTYGVRRSAFLAAGGYDGDVLFENLELARTLRAAGGSERLVPDLYVPRLPPHDAALPRPARAAGVRRPRPARPAGGGGGPGSRGADPGRPDPSARQPEGRRTWARAARGGVGRARRGRPAPGRGSAGLPPRRRALGPAVGGRTGRVRLAGARAPGAGRGAVRGAAHPGGGAQRAASPSGGGAATLKAP